MKVVVVYSWSRDPEAASVRSDGAIDWHNAKMAPGEDDAAALDVAKAVADGLAVELAGLTVADSDASWALARGVSQTTQVSGVPDHIDDAATAAVLAAAVRRLDDVGLVVIGDSERRAGVGVTLAGLLGWPSLVGVHAATVRDGRVHAARRTGDREESVILAPPAVIGVTATGADTRAPGMKEILAARKRPCATVAGAELGAPVGETVVVSGTRLPAASGARLLDGGPGQAAAGLVSALRAEGVL